jgi:hypothetical protein
VVPTVNHAEQLNVSANRFSNRLTSLNRSSMVTMPEKIAKAPFEMLVNANNFSTFER